MRSIFEKTVMWFIWFANMAIMSILIQLTKSRSRLRKIKSSREGEVFFVVGSGPSLAEIDVTDLKDENVISNHFAYKAFEGVNVRSHYWVVAAESRMADLKETPRDQFVASLWCPGSLKKLLYPFRAFSRKDIIVPPVYSFRKCRIRQYRSFLDRDTEVTTSVSTAASIPGGMSVIFNGIQLAYFLGAKKIILLGADFGASPKEDGSKSFYFSDNVPVVDKDMMEKHDPYIERYVENIRPALIWYKQFLEKKDVELYNASVFSRDDVLEKVKYDDFLSQVSALRGGDKVNT